MDIVRCLSQHKKIKMSNIQAPGIPSKERNTKQSSKSTRSVHGRRLKTGGVVIEWLTQVEMSMDDDNDDGWFQN
jgi:hypothetical protein